MSDHTVEMILQLAAAVMIGCAIGGVLAVMIYFLYVRDK